jgi:hypothetical protein
MPANFRKLLLIGFPCLIVALSGCVGFSPISTQNATTDRPSTVTDIPPNATESPVTETASRGGLLIVEPVENATVTNESEVVQYNQTRFSQSPTLNDAVAEATSTKTTQQRDLSIQEIQRIEAVAEAYNAPTGEFVVLKNGTVVRVSLGYEV